MKNRLLFAMLAFSTIFLPSVLESCAPINPEPEEITFKFYAIQGLPRAQELRLGEILAGAAKVKITPTFEKGEKYKIAGYYQAGMNFRTVNSAAQVHDDLWVRCVYFNDALEAMALVSFDLIGMESVDIEDIRERVSDIIYPWHAFLTFTHTHAAPDTMGIWGTIPLISGKNEMYVEQIKQKTEICLRQAQNNAEPAKIFFGQYQEGKKGPLLLMHIEDRTGAAIASIINYAIHPHLIHGNYISADVIWPLYNEAFEKKIGGVTIFVNGAQGGVGTLIDHAKNKKSNDWDAAWANGELIGNMAMKAFLQKEIENYPSLTIQIRLIKIPLENRGFKMAIFLGALKERRDSKGRIGTEVNLITIGGNAEIATIPGEAMPNIAEELRQLMPSKYKFVFGLTNDELGYIIRKADWEAGKHKYQMKVSVGSEIGEIVFKNLKELIGGQGD